MAKVLVGFGLVVVLMMVLKSGSENASPPPFRATNGNPPAADTRALAPPIISEPPLELVKYSWHTEYGYAILEGQVRNISAQSLKNVAAVASFYDANDGFITSSDALIDYNPVLPGQTSPFKVMTTHNPAMNKAGVEFKELMGGTISFRKAESKRSRKN